LSLNSNLPCGRLQTCRPVSGSVAVAGLTTPLSPSLASSFSLGLGCKACSRTSSRGRCAAPPLGSPRAAPPLPRRGGGIPAEGRRSDRHARRMWMAGLSAPDLREHPDSSQPVHRNDRSWQDGASHRRGANGPNAGQRHPPASAASPGNGTKHRATSPPSPTGSFGREPSSAHTPASAAPPGNGTKHRASSPPSAAVRKLASPCPGLTGVPRDADAATRPRRRPHRGAEWGGDNHRHRKSKVGHPPASQRG